ncbi:hypothetical protein ACVWVZ_000164 [Pseudomonas tolaasii]
MVSLAWSNIRMAAMINDGRVNERLMKCEKED